MYLHQLPDRVRIPGRQYLPLQMQSLLRDMRDSMEAASSRVARRLSAAEQQVKELEREVLELLEEAHSGRQ